MDNTKTGRFIAECRKELGYNQKYLAEKLNITDKAVSKWETGRSSPDVSMLIPLADVLGVSVTEILNGEKISKEEIPSVSNEIIVKSLKKSKSKKLLALILALFLLIGAFASYPLYQYLNSISINDYEAISACVRNPLKAPNDNYEGLKFTTKSDYTAYLFKDEEYAYMVLFRENEIFKNRMDFVGGTGVKLSKLGLYNCGTQYGENINIFFGAEIEAQRYTFSVMEVDYSVPIEDKDFVHIHIEKTNTFSNADNFELVEEYEPDPSTH